MASGDEFLFEVARRAVLSSLTDTDAIGYRQRILEDCLQQSAVIRQMYDLAAEAVAGSKKIYRGIFSQSPDSILRWSVEAMQLFAGILKNAAAHRRRTCRKTSGQKAFRLSSKCSPVSLAMTISRP